VGASKNRGTPKWMVKIMENPIKMDDLEGKPHYFRKHPCPSLSSLDHENYRSSPPIIMEMENGPIIEETR